MVSVPVSGLAPVFGAATNETFDVPLFPEEVIVSHDGALLDAFHMHPAGAITPTLPEPPPAGAEPVADCRLYMHVVPDCVTLML
jgi:hypothetical protein